MDYRNKHRLARSTYLVIILAILALMTVKLFRFYDSYLVLLLVFILGLIFFVTYELRVLRHLKKYSELYINSATQIYIGTVSLASATITLLLYLMFGVNIENGLFVMSIAAIAFLLATISHFDRFLERRGH